jgi:hypothetical protein
VVQNSSLLHQIDVKNHEEGRVNGEADDAKPREFDREMTNKGCGIVSHAEIAGDAEKGFEWRSSR